jgi:hypothetical protein
MNYIIKILEGKDFEVKDILTKSSDPFCVIKFGNDTFQTKGKK